MFTYILVIILIDVKNLLLQKEMSATVSLKAGPAKDVPISIKLMGDSAVSIWIDPSKTENHFGNTPIYGTQHRIA